jgi:hypothetical protein
MISLMLFGIRNNCLTSGRSLLLYQFTRKGMKLPVVNMVPSTAYTDTRKRNTETFDTSKVVGVEVKA